MKKLISKLQYKNFEVGEFIKEEKRTYEEIIKVIENFPWNSERKDIKIDLTNPSVTIENEDNNYLKLAVSFNNKFVLHYLDNKVILFTKTFTDFKDSYKYINTFFESTFELQDFKQENTWLKDNLKHFVSQDFKYIINARSVKGFLSSTSGINFCFSIFFLFMFLTKGITHIPLVAFVFILINAFFIGGGINLILFFNYYKYAKGKILIMSKGNDIFYFGNENDPMQFDKKDILQYIVKKSKSYRSPINGFALITVEFKNNTIILIPNLFVDYISLEQKLYQYKRIDEGGIPFI